MVYCIHINMITGAIILFVGILMGYVFSPRRQSLNKKISKYPFKLPLSEVLNRAATIVDTSPEVDLGVDE